MTSKVLLTTVLVLCLVFTWSEALKTGRVPGGRPRRGGGGGGGGSGGWGKPSGGFKTSVLGKKGEGFKYKKRQYSSGKMFGTVGKIGESSFGQKVKKAATTAKELYDLYNQLCTAGKIQLAQSTLQSLKINAKTLNSFISSVRSSAPALVKNTEGGKKLIEFVNRKATPYEEDTPCPQ